MTISDLAKFMVESLGKDRAEEILEMLGEEAKKNIPEETQGKITLMAAIRSEIDDCITEPREIPLELVTRFLPNRVLAEVTVSPVGCTPMIRA